MQKFGFQAGPFLVFVFAFLLIFTFFTCPFLISDNRGIG